MINWKKIWSYHAPFHKDGVSKIPLKNGKHLILKAGPGFGDLSHPTTALCLDFLSQLLNPSGYTTCVDMGTGTGILAIAAALLGAKKVYAYEIDPEAILHAKENIALNGLEGSICLNPEEPPPSFDLLLFNMISSEQQVALESHPFLSHSNHTRIVSGILTEQENGYLKKSPHGKIVSRKQEGDWVAYTFRYGSY